VGKVGGGGIPVYMLVSKEFLTKKKGNILLKAIRVCGQTRMQRKVYIPRGGLQM